MSRKPKAPRPPSTKRNAIRGEHPGRGPIRSAHEDAGIASRRTRSLDLAIAGASYRQIAAQTGVSLGTAWDDVQAELGALDTYRKEQAERLRELSLKRLDKWTLALTPKAQKGDEKAVRVLVSIEDRRAKLLGLDKPAGLDVTSGGMPLVPIARIETVIVDARDAED